MPSARNSARTTVPTWTLFFRILTGTRCGPIRYRRLSQPCRPTEDTKAEGCRFAHAPFAQIAPVGIGHGIDRCLRRIRTQFGLRNCDRLFAYGQRGGSKKVGRLSAAEALQADESFGWQQAGVAPRSVSCLKYGSANGNRTRIFRLLVFSLSY
jgi:hypothetical protein